MSSIQLERMAFDSHLFYVGFVFIGSGENLHVPVIAIRIILEFFFQGFVIEDGSFPGK